MNKRFLPIFLIIVFLSLSGLFVAKAILFNKPELVKSEDSKLTITPTYTQIPGTSTVTLTPVTTSIAVTTINISTSTTNIDKYVFYPVDKTTALASDFVPGDLISLSSVGINTVSSSIKFRKAGIADLKALVDAAKASGNTIRATSCYRSYSYQDGLFKSYVKEEMAKGLSEADATVKANTYSALPGHSEHQLGTTCDMISTTDSTLDETASNKKVWTWMDANLADYGFVLSYPYGKDDKTGYISEPWHIRWVGKDVSKAIAATDYLNQTNSNTSTSYLKQYWSQIK